MVIQKKSFMLLLALMTVLFLLSACSLSYNVHTHVLDKGKSLQDKAVLIVGYPMAPFSVDRVKLNKDVVYRGKRVADIIELAPGQRTVVVRYYKINGAKASVLHVSAYSDGHTVYVHGQPRTIHIPKVSEYVKLRYDFRPGMIYYVNYTVEKKDVKFWIEKKGPVSLSSPDGSRKITLERKFGGKRSGRSGYQYVVEANGRKVAYPILEYADNYPQFSKDGKRVAFFSRIKGRMFSIVLDGKPFTSRGVLAFNGKYFNKEFVRFSKDGKRSFFVIRKGTKMAAVVDCVKPKFYFRKVSRIFYSANSKHYVYKGYKRGSAYFVRDGKLSKPYEDIAIGPRCLSADGQTFVFAVREGRKFYYVKNGVASQERYSKISIPAVSSDGSKVYYSANVEGMWAFFVNGKRIGVYDQVYYDENCFSKDGQHYAFMARVGGECFIVVNGKKSKAFENAAKQSLKFKKAFGSTYVEYWINKNGEWRLIKRKVS